MVYVSTIREGDHCDDLTRGTLKARVMERACNGLGG